MNDGNASKTVFLGEIANLSVGFPFRSTCVPGCSGVLCCFLRDVDADGVLPVAKLKRVEGVPTKEAHVAVGGDVVFRSRGEAFLAAVVPALDEDLLVVAPMIRIRVKRDFLLPEYLVWYINGSRGAAYFNEFALGTAMPLISKSVLEKMPIKLPSLEEQRNIVDLVELNRKERLLLSEIATKKNLILEREISNYLESL